MLVALRPRPLTRWAFALIQNFEVDPRSIGREPHEPAQRIHLSNKLALRKPADRWVAAHFAHFGWVKRDQCHARMRLEQVRSSPRSLNACVPTTNHNDAKMLQE
jgi:hypothetical protein